MCTSYNYLIELTPKSSKIIVGTIFLSLQIAPAIALPPYLSFIQYNVYPFLTLGFGASVAGVFAVALFIPESPQYLFAMERYLECQESIKFIARFNGIDKSVCDMKHLHE